MSSGSRYETILRLAAGGMATVWIGAVRGALGFRQLVAIKRPHPHLLLDAGFTNELVAEARLASMIHHANVVDVRDVVVEAGETSLVMDYIEGASLGELLVLASRGPGGRLPSPAVVRIVRDACAGLHAAHELVDERERHVGLVHRDVSPQNILVGTDGIARVTDFGVAKFARRHVESTSDGSLKGKLAYMAPEYLRGQPIDRRCDVFAAGVVLWESLTGTRLFRGANEAETLRRVLDHPAPLLSTIVPELEPLDAVVALALAKAPAERFQSAAAMGLALETAATRAGLLGSSTDVAEMVTALAGPAIAARRAEIRARLADEPTVASLGAPNAEAAPAAPEPTRPAPEPLTLAAPEPTRPAPEPLTLAAPEPTRPAPEPLTLAAPTAPVPTAPTAARTPEPDTRPMPAAPEPAAGSLPPTLAVPVRAAPAPAAPGFATLRSEDGVAPVVLAPAADVLAPAATELEETVARPRRRRPLVSLVAILVLAAGAIAGVLVLGSSRRPLDAAATPDAASATSAANATRMTPADAAPAPGIDAAPEPAAAPPVEPAPPTAAASTVAPRPRPRRPAEPKASATPSATAKKPPANPYL